MLKLRTIAALILVPSLALAKACPTPPACEALATVTAQCTKSAANCDPMLRQLKKLESARYCYLPQDKERAHEIPALMLCGSKQREHLLDVLGHSTNPKVKKYFCGRSYRITLKDDLAESYNGPVEGEEDMPFYKHHWTHCPIPAAVK